MLDLNLPFKERDMDHELVAIARASKSITINFVEGDYLIKVVPHEGLGCWFMDEDLPSLIHRIYDTIML